MGARFDLAIQRLTSGIYSKPTAEELSALVSGSKNAAKVIKETVVDATASATKAVRKEL
jgi:hypothetical protein